MERKFYDQGWNDCVNGVPYQTGTLDYRSGWFDCQEAKANGDIVEEENL